MSKLAQVVEVSDCNSVNDVLNKSVTAWEPVTMPIRSVQGGPMQGSVEVSNDLNFHALIRPDTNQILGICSKRYKPNSHVVHLARLDNMVRQGDLRPERVSIWDNGSLLAYQFRAPALDAEILPGDSVSPLLTLAFYNDGKHGDMSFFADFRWACTNQLGKVAEAMNGKKRAAHRGDVQGTYQALLQGRIAELSQQAASRYDSMKRMVDRPLAGESLLSYWADALSLPGSSTDQWVDELMAYHGEGELSPPAKQLQAVLGCYREDAANAPGSLWQAFNALTRYLTHTAGRNAATRARRALLGGYDVVQAKAFETAREMVA